jgi:threonine/homoserine/homoserine lactone efflux protein
VPSLATYCAFVGALIAYQMAPGPDAMLVVGRGVGQGWRTALASVFGMTLLAGLIQLPLLTLGVVSLLRSTRLGYDLLQWGGAIYLVYLGTTLLMSRGAQQSPGSAAAPCGYSAFAALREGAICNLSNPSPWIFMLAFLPQFVDPSRGSVTTQLFIFGATQKLTGFVILSAYAAASGACGNWLRRNPTVARWQTRFCGATMIGLGLRLMFAGDLRAAAR